ncbi:MAG: carboxypeptidase-like regulatory domain-containing protein [Ferruginibacter sp.]
MNLGKIVLITTLLIAHLATNGQSFSFSGTIRDAHTKEPISFASVYFQRLGIGQTSDSAGNFSFGISRVVADTLLVSYVGYELVKIPATNIKEQSRIIIQLERGLAANDVFVKVKLNKGLFLWRKIMSKKGNTTGIT